MPTTFRLWKIDTPAFTKASRKSARNLIVSSRKKKRWLSLIRNNMRECSMKCMIGLRKETSEFSICRKGLNKHPK